MAEALLRALYGEKYDAYSAGTQPSGVNRYAVQVMKEIGIDISAQRSKSIDEFRGWNFDVVVTVCDQARESCPFFPGARKYLHQGFEDPSGFEGSEAEKLAVFRKVRDEIKAWIVHTFVGDSQEKGWGSRSELDPPRAMQYGQETGERMKDRG